MLAVTARLTRLPGLRAVAAGCSGVTALLAGLALLPVPLPLPVDCWR